MTDGKNKAPMGSIRTPSVPRPISFYALAGRDPEPNTTNRKEEATCSCCCGSEQFIQKENFTKFTYRLVIIWNSVIYTKLLKHPYFHLPKLPYIINIDIIAIVFFISTKYSREVRK